MKDRCFNPNNKSYDRYGGRGITICKEWLGEYGYEHFREWAYKNGYDESIEGLSIDRLDNDGNYEPSNCRFANNFIQANNRSTSRSHDFYGTEYTEIELARRFGIDNTTLSHRIRTGWTINEAIQLKNIGAYSKERYVAEHPGCVHEWEKITRPVYFVSHPKIDVNDPKLQYGITPEQLERARGITKEDNDKELNRLKTNFN